MLRLSQRDKKWAKDKIGKSKSTIGGNGCLITSLCMLISKFYPERGFKHYYTPAEASRDWKFVKVKGDSDPKYLAWTSINNSGIEFKWRSYGYEPDRVIQDPITREYAREREIMRKYINSKDYGVTIQVRTKKGGQHWLACWKWNIFNKPTCYDPWDKKVVWNPFGFLGKYSRCTGWALIRIK